MPEAADEIDPITHRPRDPAPYFGENDERRGSIDKLCDHWSEWDGMREIVNRDKAID